MKFKTQKCYSFSGKYLNVIYLAFITMAIIMFIHIPAFASEEIGVFVGDKKVVFSDTKPSLVNDRVLVPARAVFENLSGEVLWDEATSEITVIRNGEFTKLTIGSNIMKIGIKSTDEAAAFLTTAEITIDVPAQIIDGRTVIPLRAVAESLKVNIKWNSETNSVIIDDYEMVKADGWIYYASWSDSGKLYKIDVNGQNRQKLSNYDCYDIRLIGDYLYYHVWNDNERFVYRVNVNGSGERKISDSHVYLIKVKDNFIYYSNLDESDRLLSEYSGKLYRMDINCENAVRLSEDELSSVTFYEDMIYYSNNNDDYAIYKIDMDGKNRMKVSQDGINPWIGWKFKDGWFYFTTDDQESSLYRMDINGQYFKILEDSGRCYLFEIIGDVIYYTNYRNLYSIKTDGSGNKLLAEGKQVVLDGISDDWIYYIDIQAPVTERAIYRVDHNVENKSAVFKGDASIKKIYNDKLYILDNTGVGYDDKKGGKLYITDLDGSNAKLLCEFSMSDITIRDNQIYFRNTDDGNKYYKMDLDGNNLKRITNEQTWHVVEIES